MSSCAWSSGRERASKVPFNSSTKTKSPTESQLALLETAQLYVSGFKQSEIAEKLGVSQPMVSKRLTSIRKQWAKETVENYNQWIFEQLARIDALELHYWSEFRKSQEPLKVTTTRSRQGTTQTLDAYIRTEERTGNSVYLAGVMSCIQERSKLLGLYKPERLELSGPDGAGIPLQFIQAIANRDRQWSDPDPANVVSGDPE